MQIIIDFFRNSTAFGNLYVEPVLESSRTLEYAAVLRAVSPSNSRNAASLARSLIKLIVFILINLGLIFNSFAVCTASIPTVAFGNFAPFANTPIPITINMSVTCTGLVGLLLNYSVGFNTGSSGTFTPRQMQSGVKTLNYNLYKDVARTQILNLSTIRVTGSFTLIVGSGTNNHTIYATLPAQPLAQAGSYLDTITATVTY